MNMAIRQVLENLLTGAGYRRVDLVGGAVWVPDHFGADWPQEEAKCVSVFRRSRSWVEGGKYCSQYGVASYRYHDHGDRALGHWDYDGLEQDWLHSAEAAAAEAVAIALNRQVPVCIESPLVIHPMGDASLKLVKELD